MFLSPPLVFMEDKTEREIIKDIYLRDSSAKGKHGIGEAKTEPTTDNRTSRCFLSYELLFHIYQRTNFFSLGFMLRHNEAEEKNVEHEKST